jgi:hypothetical protein
MIVSVHGIGRRMEFAGDAVDALGAYQGEYILSFHLQHSVEKFGEKPESDSIP